MVNPKDKFIAENSDYKIKWAALGSAIVGGMWYAIWERLTAIAVDGGGTIAGLISETGDWFGSRVEGVTGLPGSVAEMAMRQFRFAVDDHGILAVIVATVGLVALFQIALWGVRNV